jgi:alpha-glucosidase
MEFLKWWQSAVFYQIYPRSFADGNGDGIGDLKGMTEKLDYLQSLGINAVWLSPHFPSPMKDCGYDVAGYCAVAPEYGSLEEFKQFLNAAHDHGIRVILDLVMNHTSDQHPWFIESCSSRSNPKRDWYVWKDGEPGNPPNNWQSSFGGSAWEYDDKTQSYYYHFFYTEQPDLNWHNPEVKQAMWDAVRFWLDMGVDGFRLDAIGTIYEDARMSDHQTGLSLEDLYMIGYAAKTDEENKNMESLWREMFKYQTDQPGMHELMKELRSLVDEYKDRVLVGESEEIAYYGNGKDELHMVFNFPMMLTRQMTPDWVRKNQVERHAAIPEGAWEGNTLNNHDSGRMFNRFSDSIHMKEYARLNTALMLTLHGTPFLYNGEEIGMTDLHMDPGNFWDENGKIAYQFLRERVGLPEGEAKKMAADFGRDKGRTPNQWDNLPNGGFCPDGVTPWLPVNPNYAQGINAREQIEDPDSLLHDYKRMIAMRKITPALIAGDFQLIRENDQKSLIFLRSLPNQKVLVALNYCDHARLVQVGIAGEQLEVIYSTHKAPGSCQRAERLSLRPFEVFIAEYK